MKVSIGPSVSISRDGRSVAVTASVRVEISEAEVDDLVTLHRLPVIENSYELADHFVAIVFQRGGES